jgi:hypothetical protein
VRVTAGSGRAREFRERGFLVVKGLLPEQAVEAHVAALERLSGRTRASFEGYRVGRGWLRRGVYRGWTLPDGVSRTPAFRDLVFLPGLLEVVREVLAPEACFLQHTDLHVGFSAVNWHRDSVTRSLGSGGDWDERVEPYRLARVGFYLQSHAESRFALGLVPGSHRRGGALDDAGLAEVERRIAPWRQAVALALGRDALAGRAEWVAAERGDAIVFDPRIVHSGSFIQGPKYSAFLAYGVPGRHFARHLGYYRHVREELGYGPLDPAFVERLRVSGLLADVERFRYDPEADAYRPGRLQKLLGRLVRARPPEAPR